MLFKLILLVMIFIIVTLSICIFIKKDQSKENYAVLIGNPLNKQINIEYDDTFTSEFMSSSYLLKLFETDGSKIIDGKLVKLSSLIKKSTIVMLNIGEFDIYSLIDKNSSNYDSEILDRTIDVYLNNLNNILIHINDIKGNKQIYVCEIENSLNIYEQKLSDVFSSLNESINEVVKKNNANVLR